MQRKLRKQGLEMRVDGRVIAPRHIFDDPTAVISVVPNDEAVFDIAALNDRSKRVCVTRDSYAMHQRDINDEAEQDTINLERPVVGLTDRKVAYPGGRFQAKFNNGISKRPKVFEFLNKT